MLPVVFPDSTSMWFFGLPALALFCLLLLLAPLARDRVVRAVDEIAAAEPRYRLLPAQAPPAA